MIRVTLLFKNLYNIASIYLSPVPFHRCSVWPGLRDALVKRALLTGPVLSFMLRLFFLLKMVHRTSPSARPVTKFLRSHPATPLLSWIWKFSCFWLCILILPFDMCFSWFTCLCSYFKLRPILLDHDSHQKVVFMLSSLILCRENCS